MRKIIACVVISFFLFFLAGKDSHASQNCEWNNYGTPPGCVVMTEDCNPDLDFRLCTDITDQAVCNATVNICVAPLVDPGLCMGNPECESCLNVGGTAHHGTWTAIGCIPTWDTNALIAWLLARAMMVAGGIALILIILGGFEVITSQGDPQKVQNGKDRLTAALAGLLLIIFSLFLLRFIGSDLLEIPGIK